MSQRFPFLFCDIETYARPEAVALLPLPTPPANWKDQEKIAAYIEEKRAAQLSDAALDPDTGVIASIALRRGAEGEITTWVVGEDGEEKELIDRFWNSCAEVTGRVCGYGILGFDLPYLLRRSLYLGIRPTHLPRLARYQHEPVRDLMELLFNWERCAKGLKVMCALLGIDNPLPDLDGSKVASMDKATLRKYNANDVHLTTELYLRMDGIYWPKEEGIHVHP